MTEREVAAAILELAGIGYSYWYDGRLMVITRVGDLGYAAISSNDEGAIIAYSVNVIHGAKVWWTRGSEVIREQDVGGCGEGNCGG